MRLLKAALAVLFLVTVAGCASKPAPTTVATAKPEPWARIVPPWTTYGCDPLLAQRLGTSC